MKRKKRVFQVAAKCERYIYRGTEMGGRERDKTERE